MEDLQVFDEGEFKVDDNPFAFSPGQLNKLLNPKSLAAYRAPGGLKGIATGLGSTTSLFDMASTVSDSGRFEHCVEEKAMNRTKILQRTQRHVERYLPRTLVELHHKPLYEHDDDPPAFIHSSNSQTLGMKNAQPKVVGSTGHCATKSLSVLFPHQLPATVAQPLSSALLRLSQALPFPLSKTLGINAAHRLNNRSPCRRFLGLRSGIDERDQAGNTYPPRVSAATANDAPCVYDGTRRPIQQHVWAEVDDKQYMTGPSLAPCDIFGRTLGHEKQQNVDFVTPSSDIFASSSALGIRSNSKLWLSFLTCCVLSNVVAAARPSDTAYWSTLVSGTFSTLCSVLELRLPTVINTERIDLPLVMTSLSLLGLSLLLCIVFVWCLQHGWLEGREKNVYALLVAFFTPQFVYLASRSLIQEGHHWLEGIPLFVNMCALLVTCGITGLRNMRPGRRY